MYLIYLVLYLILTSMGLLLMKLGSNTTKASIASPLISMNVDIRLILGIFCYACSFLLYAFVLQKKDLSLIYPICTGIVNILSVILGIWILHEKISGIGIAGILLISIGIVLLGIGKG